MLLDTLVTGCFAAVACRATSSINTTEELVFLWVLVLVIVG